MKKVAIILRKSDLINRFQDIIVNTCQNKIITNCIICSGFFQERPHGYQASVDFNVLSPSNRNDILSLTIVGLYSYNWRNNFNAFINNVRRKRCCTCTNNVIVSARFVRGAKWHAKIFIAKTDGDPVLGIIGSSNFTSRAFGKIQRNFNYECDVVFWDENITSINKIMQTAFEELSNPHEIMIMDYDENFFGNRQLSLKQRLLQLEKEIFEISTEYNIE